MTNIQELDAAELRLLEGGWTLAIDFMLAIARVVSEM